MYPTIVVVMVETQRSMVDICEIGQSTANKVPGVVASDPEAHAIALGHLSHAGAGPINIVMENEGESRSSRALQRQDVQEHGLEKVTRRSFLK